MRSKATMNTILCHIRLSACIHDKVDSFFKITLVTVSGVLLNINSALLPENDGAETCRRSQEKTVHYIYRQSQDAAVRY